MTAIRRIMAPGILIIGGCLASCDHGISFDYAGEWRGERPVIAAQGTNPDIARSLAHVRLVVDNQGKFSLLENNLTKGGVLQPSGKGAVLAVETLMGVRMERQSEEVRRSIPRYEVVPQPDGALLFVDPRASNETVRLTRASKP